MRRSVLAGLTLALIAAAPARAEHHLMQVTEVAPVGSQDDQFIELRDPVPEAFPSQAYSVAATDASGTPLASQVLSPGPFRLSTDPFLLGGSSVSPRDADLGFAIPPAAARVCFYDGDSPPAGQINCLSYGHLTVAPGQSAQRLSCGVVAAPPSPDAINGNTGCAGGGSGGGGGTGGGGGQGGGGQGGGGMGGGSEGGGGG
jgi:hypothetical protein